ncbi:MAG: OmpA family protein [Acidobacteria bacterium]|nr:OmpA family protein [Acidobacteriota bacterium]
MKAAKRICTLVLMLLVLGGLSLAQSGGHGNLAQQQKAPTVLGGTGLFNTFSTRTLCKGEFNFALFWNNFDRDPGDLDINQVPFNFTVGLTNRWELWVDWVTWQQTTSRSPFLLSGYQYSAVRLAGDPSRLLGPAIGGTDHSAAFYPGTGALFGGILPKLGAFGTPINFGQGLVPPGGPYVPITDPTKVKGAVGLGPAFITPLPGFYNDLPFFGEVDFLGFNSSGNPVFGPRQSSNGSGDVYLGTKVNLINPDKNWFSVALGGYLKIPISRDEHAQARGRTNGEYEYGPILMLGQESGGKRFRLYENFGYIHTGDPERGGVKALDLADKLLLNFGTGIAVNKHAEVVAELLHTRYVGSSTPHFGEKDPLELNLGLRFFFKGGALSFGGAYRRLLNKMDAESLQVLRFTGFTKPFFFVPTPIFDTPNQSFGNLGGADGFVGYISVGSRKSCPPPPAPTCVLSVSSTTVNRGERVTLTDKPSTPGYADGQVNYEYKWEVKDASGRPVTISGTGASVDVATGQLPCGSYMITASVTASVPAVDCPSDCITTGTTSCTARFEVTEPPCPTVTCQAVTTPTSVNAGEPVTLRATASGAGNFTFNWSATGGRLSSTSGSEVTIDTNGLDAGTYTVTVNVATDKTSCDKPCPGSSCTTSFTVTKIPPPEIVNPLVPCGPIFFPFNSARINNEHKACLDDVALRMQQDPRAALVIDGHRDSTERVGISLTRANNARDYLVNEKGVDASRITVRNYGDTCPHESGDANLNRRVEFFILPERATMEGVNNMKKCGAGASPRVITDETPAESVDKKRPVRRVPRKAKKGRKHGEPIITTVQ